MFGTQSSGEVHLFEAAGHKLAFNPTTYGIAVLDEVGYDVLTQVSQRGDFVGDEAQAKRFICSLVESQFLGPKEGLGKATVEVSQHSLQALCLIITSQCNLRCDYCYNEGGRYQFKQRKTMTRRTAHKAIDFLFERCDSSQSCHVSFFGGEPLSQYQLIKDTVDYALGKAKAAGAQITFHITTNGTLITSEIAEFLHQHNFSIIVSIDGNETTHNLHRKRTRKGEGSYGLALRGAKMLAHQYGSQDKIMIRGTYTHHQQDISGSFLHLRDCGFQNISLEPCFGPATGDYAIGEQDLPKLLSEYAHMAEVYSREESAAPLTSFFHFQKVIDVLKTMQRTDSPCGAANGYIAVAPDGGLYPCHRIVDDNHKLGSVNDSTIILDGRIRESFLAATTNNRSGCQSCWARGICGGSCYANSLDNEKSIHEHDDVGCAVTRMFIEHSIAALALKNLREEQGVSPLKHAIIVHLPTVTHADARASSCPVRASCDYGCQSSCTSSCTSGCQMGCTSSCTGGCTARFN